MQTPLNEIEFSIKVSGQGLNNNRMVLSLNADDVRINHYIRRYFSDISTELLEQDFQYDNILFGIDGNTRKMYLENDQGTLISIENRDGAVEPIVTGKQRRM